MLADHLDLLRREFVFGCGLRFPQYLFSDRVVTTLLIGQFGEIGVDDVYIYLPSRLSGNGAPYPHHSE